MKQFTDGQLLSRVRLDRPLLRVLKDVTQTYSIGSYMSHSLVRVGYGDLNIVLTTLKGRYFVKIFSKEKSPDQITSYLKVIQTCQQKGIPTTRLYTYRKQNVLYKNPNLCVMEFLNGKSLENKIASKKDLLFITRFMTRIHSLRLKVVKNYDSWGTQHFLEEYKRKLPYASARYQTLTKQMVREFKKIDFTKFRKCLVHGDIHDEHLIKTRNEGYKVIDFETVDNGYGIVDFSIFLAMLAVNPMKSVEHNQNLIKELTNEYAKVIPVSTYERSKILLLIQTTYLMYYLSARYEYVVNKDRTDKVKMWMRKAKKGLKFCAGERTCSTRSLQTK